MYINFRLEIQTPQFVCMVIVKRIQNFDGRKRISKFWGPHHFPETSFHGIVVLPKTSYRRMSIGRIVILPNSKIAETI